jgi:hypothetical protein
MEDWQDYAECLNYPTDWFWGNNVEMARVICALCPVITQCHDFIMRMEPDDARYGFVAGMTPNERRLEYIGDPSPPVGKGTLDPVLVQSMVDDYVFAHGVRRGAVKEVAELLGVHPNTVANTLKRLPVG